MVKFTIPGFLKSKQEPKQEPKQELKQEIEKGGLAGKVRLPDHPEVRQLPAVLLLDTSDSMRESKKIEQLSEGLKFFKKELIEKDARKSVSIAVVTFGKDVEVIHDFTSIEHFEPPILEPEGFTPMGKAIRKAIEMIQKQKEFYKSNGIKYFRPWIFMITDGEPTDMGPEGSMWVTVDNEKNKKAFDAPKRLSHLEKEWIEVVNMVHNGEANNRFQFFAVGVKPAKLDILERIAPPNRAPLMLQEGAFDKMFDWLGNSLEAISQSKEGEMIVLEDPKTKNGWAQIKS